MAEIIVDERPITRQRALGILLYPDGSRRGLKKYEVVLELFWAAFPWRECKKSPCRRGQRCRFISCLPRAKTKLMLKAMAEIVLSKKDRNRQGKARAHHNRHRDEQDDRPCFVCGERFDHRHHILQIQHGGLNMPKNLVLLCKSCHREVHRG